MAADAPSAPPVVEAIGVTKRYGPTTALDAVGLSVAPGSTHALVGRNGAGKSTLVSVLTGLTPADAGTVRFHGRPAPHLADRDAWREVVACVYQRSTTIPGLTVAENLFLGRHPLRAGRLISWRELRRRARELLETWQVDVDVSRPAGELTVEQRQFVEIARALSFGARFIVLDEPTARLDGPAITRLFEQLRQLQRQGVTILFISHHLQEVFEICDTVTVFRDARHISTRPVAGLDESDLVADMTGEVRLPGAARSAAGDAADGGLLGAAPVMEARGLGLDGAYQDVDLTVRPGEIVGLAGIASSGRTEFAETVAGLRAPDRGTLEISGRPARPGDVRAAIRGGVGLVPQDRHHQGFVANLSVAENATMTVPERLGPAGTVRPSARDALARTLIDRLDIKTDGPRQPVDGLSGGNQQKVVMARALAGDPRLLVMVSPTAGVDVRSKETLLSNVARVAAEGTGVLIASDELEDLRGCHRVVVMFGGRIAAEHAAGWHDNEMVAAMEGIGHA
ncbi:multidrug ABC transporter ATP-binding protein [Mangrovactinospora gilvigrisea]|uniref:Multidrug ABC transporter ATP-binding protein n=1 Tax=Mangrovactinospora gilvigrisea TaxID=1428644 RepID=A0A1J7BAT1_9ACTN|nr:sugar ABC transporter ATP-binding protein [Mangrovactinospora gilvigrisea]OIV35807.1 multidrug ABC transporter ATP-binding protein [Mangrovactinospora gilvigrisea]